MAHLGGIEAAEPIAARQRRFLALPATEGMFTILGHWMQCNDGTIDLGESLTSG